MSTDSALFIQVRAKHEDVHIYIMEKPRLAEENDIKRKELRMPLRDLLGIATATIVMLTQGSLIPSICINDETQCIE